MLANPFAKELAGPAIAWLLTYLLHGTILLGLAGLVSKPLARWSVSAEETVWKLALVGALLTASLASFLLRTCPHLFNRTCPQFVYPEKSSCDAVGDEAF